MNEELEFSAWDERDKKMVYFSFTRNILATKDESGMTNSFISHGDTKWRFGRDGLHIRQSIGWRDVVKSRIYVNDLVKIDGHGENIWQVVFDNDELKYVLTPFTKGAPWLKISEYRKNMLVVGNIYEGLKNLK